MNTGGSSKARVCTRVHHDAREKQGRHESSVKDGLGGVHIVGETLSQF